MVRAWILAGLFVFSSAGCRQAPAPKVAPAPSAKLEKPEPAVDVAAADVRETVAIPKEPSCNPGRRQQGKGCDMAGIMAAIRPLRQPGAPIPACYIAHVRPPRNGKLLVRFSLDPDGRAGGWQWTQDDFALPALEQCLQEALAAVTYPPPGDKPCQVVYPFTFIPEVRSGE